MRRLGPQDPLSWVRDTREKSPPPRERGPEHQGLNRALPAERRTFKIQSEGENPIEVTVVVKGEKEDRIICVKVAEEGRKATKIEVRNSDPQKESPNQEAVAS
jgi:hypothetical protein